MCAARRLQAPNCQGHTRRSRHRGFIPGICPPSSAPSSARQSLLKSRPQRCLQAPTLQPSWLPLIMRTSRPCHLLSTARVSLAADCTPPSPCCLLPTPCAALPGGIAAARLSSARPGQPGQGFHATDTSGLPCLCQCLPALPRLPACLPACLPAWLCPALPARLPASLPGLQCA